MDGTWRVSADRELSMSSGLCLVYAPGTFGHDEEAQAVVLDPHADPLDVVRFSRKDG